MRRAYPDALPLTQKVLGVLIALNLISGVLIGLLLAASLLEEEPVMTGLGLHPVSGAVLLAARVVMAIGICGVGLTHLALIRVQEIVDTVGAGDPFVAGNAARLAWIAWAVLGLELLHLAVVVVTRLVSTRETTFDVGGGISVAPWLAVLLLFVLARVFEHGTRMREELEGTI